jgi:hypothetical protein
MAVFIKDGKAYYRDPSSGGALVTVDEDKEAPAHFIPVSEAQLKADAQKKRDESIGGIAATVASRAASALTSLPQAAARVSRLGAGLQDPRAAGAAGVGGIPAAPGPTLGEAQRAMELDRVGKQAVGELNFSDPSRPAWQQAAGQFGANEFGLAEDERRRSAANPIAGIVGEVVGSAAIPSPVGLAKGVAGKALAGLAEGAVLGQVGAQTSARLEGRSVTTTAEDLAGLTIGGVLSGVVGALMGRFGGGAKKATGLLEDLSESGLPNKTEAINRPPPIIRDSPEQWYSAQPWNQKVDKIPLESVVPQSAKADPLEFFSPVAKAIGKKQVSLGGAGEDIMAVVGVGSEHPLRDAAREVIRNPQSSRRAAAKDMGAALKTMFETEDLIHDYNTNDAWRAANVEKLMGDTIEPAKARELARKAAGEAKDVSRQFVFDTAEVLAAPRHEGAIKHLRQHLGAIETMGDEFAEIERRLAVPPGHTDHMSAAEGYSALNAAKRNAGKYVARVMPDEANARLLGSAEVYQDIRAFLGNASDDADGGLYGRLRNFLEDESVWGAAGAVQREVNAGVHQAQGVSSQFLNRVANHMPAENLMSRKKWVVDSAKMEALIDEIGQHPDGQLAIDLANRLDSANRAVAVLKKFEAPGFGDLDRVAKAIPEAKKSATLAKRNSEWLQAYREQILGAQQNTDTLRMLQPATMGVMGAGLGGVVAPGLGMLGAAAGLGSGLAFRPAGTLFAAHRIRGMVGALQDAEFSSATKAVINGVSKTAPVSRQASAVAGHLADIVDAPPSALAKVAGVGGVAAFMAGGESLDTSYRERVAEIRKLQDDPLALIERLHAQVPGLGEEDPELSAETVKEAQRIVQWLADKIPEGQAPRGVFNSQTPEVSRNDMLRFARDWSAAIAPLSVLHDAARGKLTDAQVQSFKELYPERYKAIQQEAMDSAIEYAATQKIPYVQRLQLDTLLQMRGEGIPRLSVATSQQILGGKASGGAKGRRAKVATGMAKSTSIPEMRWPSARQQ